MVTKVDVLDLLRDTRVAVDNEISYLPNQVANHYSVFESVTEFFDRSEKVIQDIGDLPLYSKDVKNILDRIYGLLNTMNRTADRHSDRIAHALPAIAASHMFLNLMETLIVWHTELALADNGVRPNDLKLDRKAIDKLSTVLQRLKEKRNILYNVSGVKKTVENACRKHSTRAMYTEVYYDLTSLEKALRYIALPESIKQDVDTLLFELGKRPDVNETAQFYRLILKGVINSEYNKRVSSYVIQRIAAYTNAIYKIEKIFSTYIR